MQIICQQIFAHPCLIVIYFVDVMDTLFLTANSPNENRIYVNIWSKEYITSSDVQRFHTKWLRSRAIVTNVKILLDRSTRLTSFFTIFLPTSSYWLIRLEDSSIWWVFNFCDRKCLILRFILTLKTLSR